MAGDEATVPGKFVGILGYEYRCERGDTVVLFCDDVPYGAMDDPEISSIAKLWASYSDLDFITIPHFHNPGELAVGQWPA